MVFVVKLVGGMRLQSPISKKNSTNIELTNVAHHTNITNLHKYVNNCKTNQTNKMDIEKK
jgi:hypothetical protein